jgi:hypothetical protein
LSCSTPVLRPRRDGYGLGAASQSGPEIEWCLTPGREPTQSEMSLVSGVCRRNHDRRHVDLGLEAAWQSFESWARAGSLAALSCPGLTEPESRTFTHGHGSSEAGQPDRHSVTHLAGLHLLIRNLPFSSSLYKNLHFKKYFIFYQACAAVADSAVPV